VIDLNLLNYNELSKSKNPFGDFKSKVRDHLEALKTSYLEDIEVQEASKKKFKAAVQAKADIVKTQLDVNNASLTSLIEEAETKVSVLKRLYNEAKLIKLDCFEKISQDILEHISKNENTIKRYTQIKESLISYDDLTEEEKLKRLEGYNKAILNNITYCEKSIAEYQYKIHELDEILNAT
jgi:phage-related minor tail protein